MRLDGAFNFDGRQQDGSARTHKDNASILQEIETRVEDATISSSS